MRSFIWILIMAAVILGGIYFLGQNQVIIISVPEKIEPLVEKIKIGFMGPLSGDAVSYGENIKRGFDLALKNSGLSTSLDVALDKSLKTSLSNISVIYEDSKCDAKESLKSVEKLINTDKVVAIVGEVCSGATLSAAPIAESNKVVMISSSSTSPSITEAGNFIFRTIPSDALQGDFGAKIVYNKGYKKLAILYSSEQYGVDFNKILSDSFTKLGGKIVIAESFKKNPTDLKSQFKKIISKKPDALFIVSNSSADAVLALKQVKTSKLKAALFGSEALKSDDILTFVKDTAGSSKIPSVVEGLRVLSIASGTEDFIANYNEEYKLSPGPFAAQAYDAFWSIAQAIGAGAKTGEEIRASLVDIEFNGASGHIKFDKNGDVSENYEVYVVKDGKFQVEK